MAGVLSFGCSNSQKTPTAAVCAPGVTQLCLCGPSTKGVQTCNVKGSGWGKCTQCTTPATSARAGLSGAPPSKRVPPSARIQRRQAPVKPSSCDALLATAESLTKHYHNVANTLETCRLRVLQGKKRAAELSKQAVNKRRSVKRMTLQNSRANKAGLEEIIKLQAEVGRLRRAKCNPRQTWPFDLNKMGQIIRHGPGVQVNLADLKRKLGQQRRQAFQAIRARRACAARLNDVRWKARLRLDSRGGVRGDLQLSK